MKIKIIKESNDIKAALDAIPRMKPGQLTRYGPPEKRETRYDPETGKSITELPPGYTQVDPTEFPEEFRKIQDVVRSNTGTVDRHISHAIQANDMVKELAYQTYEDGFSSILSLAERRLSTKAALRSKELHDIQTGL